MKRKRLSSNKLAIALRRYIRTPEGLRWYQDFERRSLRLMVDEINEDVKNWKYEPSKYDVVHVTGPGKW